MRRKYFKKIEDAEGNPFDCLQHVSVHEGGRRLRTELEEVAATTPSHEKEGMPYPTHRRTTSSGHRGRSCYDGDWDFDSHGVTLLVAAV